MKILRNYLLKEFALPFFLSLSVILFVMLLGNLRKFVELIITQGVSFFDVSKIVVLMVPYLLSYAVPIAVLTAVLLSLGRLSSDNEIIAIRASGINVFMLILPLLVMGIVLSLFQVILNDKIIPQAHFAARKTLIDIGIKNPTAALEAGTFIYGFQNYILFVYAIEKNPLTNERNILNKVRIYEPQGKDKPSRTIIAKRGEFVSLPEKGVVKLKLIDGMSDEPDPNNPGEFFKLNFKTHYMTLSVLNQEDSSQLRKKPKDMTIKELRDQIAEYDPQHIDTIPLISEIHEKLSLAFSVLVFILVAAPMAVITHRREKSLNFGLAFLIVIFYYVLLITFKALSEHGFMPPAISMWMCNIIFGVLGSYLMLKLCVS